MLNIERKILLNPGPATTTDSVKDALLVPDICPREEEFGKIINEIRNDLLKIVHAGNEYTSVLFSGSGTAVMDSVINSVVPPDKKIAVIVNGVYGDRMLKIAETYKIKTVLINFEWDKKINLSEVEKILNEDNDISCLSVVHHETTTGMLNPVKEIGLIAKKNNCTFIVDAISSFAGIPLYIKENNIDYMLGSSNKCIQGMAGISFVICNKTELEKVKSYPKRSFYLDLYSQYNYFEKNNQSQFTPPVQIAYALKQAINEYFLEGENARYERYTENWKVLREGLSEMGFKFLLDKEDESHLLLTVYEKGNMSFEKLHDLLYQRGFTIYPGKLSSEKTFRLANIGDINSSDIRDFLINLKDIIENN